MKRIVKDTRIVIEDQVSSKSILMSFFATCLIASANYVINEWLDAEFDQFHPTKKVRPVVGGYWNMDCWQQEVFCCL